MYSVSEQQIEYILNDIRRNGVEMEDLQLNLLDHICCILEQNLKDGDDFESYYQKTIKEFYRNNLWEIEEETITLLTFKNYYAMKKSMIVSGAISVGALLFGSFLKIMHWPGASAMLVLGIGIMSFVFLPILFFFRNKNSLSGRDKLITGLGVVLGILLCMSTLFKVMHWPGASALWITTSAVSIFIFIPTYFFTGIRNPETKTNTFVTTIILIGATGLLFTLTSVRKSKQLTNLFMYDYLRNEQLLAQMQAKAGTLNPQATEIANACDKIKTMVIENEIGMPKIPSDFEEKNLIIYEGGLSDAFTNDGIGSKLMQDLKSAIEKYNATGNKIPVEKTILDNPTGNNFQIYSNLAVLSGLNQIELFLASEQIKPTTTEK